MVRMVDVATFRRTLRFSSGEKKRLVCRLTCCSRAFFLLEKVTRLALLAFLPVMSQTRLIEIADAAAGRIGAALRSGAAWNAAALLHIARTRTNSLHATISGLEGS